MPKKINLLFCLLECHPSTKSKKLLKLLGNIITKIIILYCVSGYPTKEKDSNLNTLRYYKKVFKNYNVGISDHTDDIITSLTASALGAKVIEKHFIISKKSRTVDSKFSIDAKQLKELQSKVQRCINL